jgi:hypothetical protein
MARARRPETGLTEGNEDNKGLQRGENIIFVSFVIFYLESSVRSLLCFWFALLRDIHVMRGFPDSLKSRCAAIRYGSGSIFKSSS